MTAPSAPNRRSPTAAISTRPAPRAGTFLIEWLSREMFGVDPRREKEIIAALEAEADQRARSAPAASLSRPIGRAA